MNRTFKNMLMALHEPFCGDMNVKHMPFLCDLYWWKTLNNLDFDRPRKRKKIDKWWTKISHKKKRRGKR